MTKTILVELNITEVMELVSFNWKMYNAIPKEKYKELTMAGHIFEVTALKYYKRYQELDELLNTIWPKIPNTGGFIPDEYEICDFCLELKYRLETSTDSDDQWGFGTDYVKLDQVLAVIRKAEKTGGKF